MPKIFIGSSLEALPFARAVDEVLSDLRAQTTGWWYDDAFHPGESILEGIERLGRMHDAALLLATEDDRTTKRGQQDTTPRDNLVFEAGYFAARYGRKRAPLALLGSPKLPTDLNGIVHLKLPDPERRHDSEDGFDLPRFRERIRAKLEPWLATLSSPMETPAPLAVTSTNPAIAAVATFYEAINRGIGGDPSGWAKMWSMLSEERRGDYAETFPEDEFPSGMKRLYHSSSRHTIRWMGGTWNDDTGRGTVDLIYELTEQHFRHGLSEYHLFQRSPTLNEFYAGYPDKDALAGRIIEDLQRYYCVPSEAHEHLKRFLGQRRLQELFGGRLMLTIREGMVSQGVLLRAGPHQYGASEVLHYSTWEFRRVFVETENGRQVIAKNSVYAQIMVPEGR